MDFLIGEKVTVMRDYDDLRAMYGRRRQYPNKGDVLTVKGIRSKSYNTLLSFEEIDGELALYSEPNFLPVLWEGSEEGGDAQ